MKVSEGWLRELVTPPGGTDSLVHQLTMQGLEVESVEPAAPALAGVVVGLVLSTEQHPNADRLRVCQVNAGEATLQVVCGAANVTAGGLYPLALPGAVLPNGTEIRQAALRGVESAGMLCSAVELGLADAATASKGDGLLELDAGTLPGTPVAAALALPDSILDLKITPNRADCFSVVGVARDLAAALDLPFRDPAVASVPEGDAATFPVDLRDEADSPAFLLRAVRGLRPDARSPVWLRERLRRSGVRSISPVVDVTNLVMLELGQPLHAYDLDKLRKRLEVRRARAGERLTLLTGAEVELDGEFLVIADQDGAVGLAGIMGGARTAVAAGTTNVLLESAFFSPGVIAGRARRLGLQTDASTRFERGVDPTGQQRALERATDLLLAIAGGTAGATRRAGSGTPPPRPVKLRRSRLALVLGDSIPDEEVAAILHRLGMGVEARPDGWQVTPPAFRFDIAVEVDLIEEVARIHGYDRLPPSQGIQHTRLGIAPADSISADQLRAVLVQRGYQEAITYSFVDEELDGLIAGGRAGLRLANPLSAELAVMRQSLWPGLLGALGRNLARQQHRVRLFEMGVRFPSGPERLAEEAVVAGLAAGSVLPEQWAEHERVTDFHDLKSDVEALLCLVGRPGEFTWHAEEHPSLHPGRSARVKRGGQHAGWVGALHPRLLKAFQLDGAPVLFELSLGQLTKAAAAAYQGVSRFPGVRRDLALLVSRETPAGALVEAVRSAAGPGLREVIVFDIFEGRSIDPGLKSVALGLILQETSRTLTDAETDKIIGGVVQRLATDFNARIRE